MEKTQLRSIILDVLRRYPIESFQSLQREIRERYPVYLSVTDDLIVDEIIWELIVQGVIAPGMNSANRGLPWIHLTEYGRKSLKTNDFMPHDVLGYMSKLESAVGQTVDGIVTAYVRESLLTFLGGQYIASTVMLGVASERCVDLLIKAYSDAIADDSRKSTFEEKVAKAGRSVKRRFDVLRAGLLDLKLAPELSDALDIHLSGIFTLIRYTRNDAGHPIGQKVEREEAYGNLVLFPQYCKRVYELINYFSTNPA